MPATISHALSMTTPDDPLYENKPSNWNATHALTLSATGSEIVGAFSNANGVSFGLSAGAVTASHNALTTAAQSNHSHGNPQLNLTNISGTTASNSAGFTLSLSADAGGAGSSWTVSDAATSGTVGRLAFTNLNGVTLSLSTGAAGLHTIVGSHNALTSQSNQTGAIYHVGNTTGQSSSSTYDARTLSFDGAGIVSVGWSNSTVRISATQSNQAFSADASSTFQTLTFQNSNLVSFSNNAGAIRITHDLMASTSRPAFSADASSTFQTLTLQNSNGISFSNNAGAVRITHDLAFSSQTNLTGRIYVTAQSTGQSSSSTYDLRTLSIIPDGIISAGWSAGSFRISATQSNQAFSADASSTFQTLTFQNSNGLSFSNNAGAIRVTYTVPVVSNALQSVGSATGSGTNTSRFAADDHVHAGVFSMGVSTGGNTAGDTRVDVGRFVFVGSNITLSQGTAAGALNTITISAAAPGAAAITQSIGMSTQTAGGATAGTTGYATGDDVLYHFVPGSNITMSQSVNGASATLSIYGPAAGGTTYSGFDPQQNDELVSHGGANATLYLQHLTMPHVQFDRVGLWFTHSNATNSSGSLTMSAHIGIYTRNASTLSLLASTSATIAYTASGTVGSYSQFGGIKIWAVPWTTTMSASNYWIGRLTRSTTGGANMTFGAMGLSNVASTWSGYLGSASNATNHRFIGQGVYSATVSTLPGAISLTQINGNSSVMHRQPAFAFLSNIF